MPTYRYKARDKTGKAVKGTISGADKRGVAYSLDGIGCIPVSIEEIEESRFAHIVSYARTISLADLNMFTRQLLALQKAGLPLLVSLEAIEKQLKNRQFKDIIKGIVASIEGGSSLSTALERYPQVFNELYVNMIRAGETGGILDDILERLANLGEKELDTRARIQAATQYPMIAFGALCVAFIIVITFVIPKFASVFAQYKTALPLPTRMLMGVSAAVKGFWPIELAAVAGTIVWFRHAVRTARGRLAWDNVVLKTPVFGELVLMLTLSRLTRVIAILIRSGLPMLQVLDMASRTAGNAVLSRAMAGIAVSVKEGKGLSEPMRLAGIFPPIVVQMVAVGEETGKVDELLINVSDYFEQQADYRIKNLTVMIEPFFVLVLGVMVLIMGLAIFLPMWNFATLFQR